MNNTCGVYIITNKITGEQYIGSSKNIERRWYNYRSKGYRDKYKNSRIYMAITTYGLENFTFEVLEYCQENTRKNREQHYIETIKPSYNDRSAFGRNPPKAYKDVMCLYNGKMILYYTLSKYFYRHSINDSAIKYVV